MAIPPHFLEELRSRVSLASVVGRHVRLARKGREYVGLCPFHKEKTPSFNVVEDKGFFHCFGCGAHGDVVGFAMRMSSLSFREAVDQLAREAGLKVPIDSPQERERQERAANLHDVCEAACAFFQRQLKAPSGKQGLDYLVRRGLDAGSIEKYRLGWAPDSRESLKRALGPHFAEDLLVSAGVLHKPERGESFDFFRGRVIFPISDRTGKIIGFGGRILGEGQPKYLNSPDTPIFDKGRTLFGLHIARDASKSNWPPIVVEGYMDAISLHLAGFTRAVAPLGTALTEHQLLELWKLTADPVICFDGDTAGQRAADRALDRALPLLRPEFSLRFAILPEKDDPDSLIKSKGAGAFESCLKRAFSVSDFLWWLATEKKDDSHFSSPEKVLRLESRVRARISKIDNREVQRSYQHFLYDKIWELRHRLRQAKLLKKDRGKPRSFGPAGFDIATDARTKSVEVLLVAMAINHPEIAQADIESLPGIEFGNKDLGDIWQVILQELGGQAQPDSLRLRAAIADHGLGTTLDRVFQTEAYRGGKFAHYGADQGFARAGWNASMAKSRLPGLKAELEDAILKWANNATDEALATVSLYRDIISSFETEEEYVQQQWEGLVHDGSPRTLH